MGQLVSMRSAQDFQSAFRVEPELGREALLPARIGIYRWSTPDMDGFELPVCDDLVVAMHMGGSQRVRAITERGPSRSRSSPGLLTILPAGRSAAFRTEGSVRLVSLHISRAAFAIDWPVAPRFAFQDSFAGAAMDALQRVAGDRQTHAAEYIARISGALLYHLAHGSGLQAQARPALGQDAARGDGALTRLMAYIDANLGNSLDLENLAGTAGLSRATLVRRLRQATGLSPHQYVIARRIEAAKTLLRQNRTDLAFIALETGFSSQSHFTSVFQGATGLTPGQFRQRH
ncbi:MAG: AraC family transcriptional regulator [Nevskia sp.]|nr:AraC family transcriptional regulator [Nevskia sp.]